MSHRGRFRGGLGGGREGGVKFHGKLTILRELMIFFLFILENRI